MVSALISYLLFKGTDEKCVVSIIFNCRLKPELMDDCRLYEGIHQERGGARDGEGRGEGWGEEGRQCLSLKKRMQVKFLLVIITRFFSGEGREEVFLNNTSQKLPF